MQTKCFVGVNLDSEQVVAIALDSDAINADVILNAEFGMTRADIAAGVIYIDADDSFAGRRALAIAMQNDGCGLGWTFKVRHSALWSVKS